MRQKHSPTKSYHTTPSELKIRKVIKP